MTQDEAVARVEKAIAQVKAGLRLTPKEEADMLAYFQTKFKPKPKKKNEIIKWLT